MMLIKYLEKYDLLERVEPVADDVWQALHEWDFAINYRSKRRFGCCKPSRKLIEVTNEYFENGAVKYTEFKYFINTLLHETAHAIVHERYGSSRYSSVQAHGREWKTIMRQLGAKTERCGSSTVLEKSRSKTSKSPKHRYICKDCDYVIESQRKMVRMERRTHRGCGHKEHGGHLTHQQLR